VFGPDPTRVDGESLARFIDSSDAFSLAWANGGVPVQRVFVPELVMAPLPGAPAGWSVPALTTAGALAEWLGLPHGELDWFADCHGREAHVPDGPLRHYTYRWIPRRGGKARLLEMPKPRLKAIQRRILRAILDAVPPHDSAHGFRRGRSLLGYVEPHTARRLVLRMDLRDFFPSVSAGRVHALFRTAGYPRGVARLLTGLCTNVVPPAVLRDGPGDAAVRHFAGPHLPQGAATSPALANLCAYRLDCRLAALAQAAGAAYTRYADDLAFSGGRDFERAARRFQVHVCRIALEEGFEVQPRKSRFMRQAVCQQLAGVVVNTRPNRPRAEYDRLKATLHNCVRYGPGSQNRDGHTDFRGHLAGRVAFWRWLHPARGGKLLALFERISWEEAR
jgi:hypothetical protein